MSDYDAAFLSAATAPMKLPGETFEAYARRIWPLRHLTGRPHEAMARYIHALASVNPYATEDPA